jgi:hypothetical protein
MSSESIKRPSISKRQARTGENPEPILSEMPEARELGTAGSGVEAEGSMFTATARDCW